MPPGESEDLAHLLANELDRDLEEIKQRSEEVEFGSPSEGTLEFVDESDVEWDDYDG